MQFILILFFAVPIYVTSYVNDSFTDEIKVTFDKNNFAVCLLRVYFRLRLVRFYIVWQNYRYQ